MKDDGGGGGDGNGGGPAYRPGSALRKVFVLLASQVLSRGLTFLLNVATVRAVGVASFGVSSVNLLLLEATVLMLGREGIRRACPRFAPSCTSAGGLLALRGLGGDAAAAARAEARRRRMLNVAWLSPALGLAAAAAVTPLFAGHTPEGLDAAELAQYRQALWLTAAASVLTLAGEPLYVLADCHVMFALRAKIEAAAVFARCVVTFVLVVYCGGGLAAFAWAQMAYAAVFALSYGARLAAVARGNARAIGAGERDRLEPPYVDSAADLLPRASVGDGGPWTSPELAWLALSFGGQSVLKLVLTEGEKLVLMLFGGRADDSGVYGLVQNLGSLVARFLFLPLEESCFAEFSNLLGSSRAAGVPAADARRSRAEAARLLGAVVKLVTLVGLVFVAFGPAYSFVLFDVLYGAKWSGTDAPFVLSVYCLYILCIAVNGVTEAFIYSAIPQAQMRGYNALLVGFSAVYLAGATALVGYGPAGVILANCANMAARIAYSAWFVRGFYRGHGDGEALAALARAVLPSPAVLGALAASAAATAASSRALAVPVCGSLLCYAKHVCVGAACLAACVAAVARYERAFLGTLRSIWSRRVAVKAE